MGYSQQVFDIVKFEKKGTIARSNLFREIAKLRQILEAAVVLGMISWSTACVPAVAKTAAAHAFRFSAYLFNHHVVFLIGNAIIILLFVLCRRNDAVRNSGDLYHDYVKFSEAAAHCGEPTLLPLPESACRGSPVEQGIVGSSGDEEKQIVVCGEEMVGIPQCDDVAVVIQKAARQIKRFQRTQSEKLRREIGARPQGDLRRSESQISRKTDSSEEQFEATDMERLSSEEFRRTVDAFIDKHWSKKKMTKQNRFEENVEIKVHG